MGVDGNVAMAQPVILGRLVSRGEGVSGYRYFNVSCLACLKGGQIIRAKNRIVGMSIIQEGSRWLGKERTAWRPRSEKYLEVLSEPSWY